MGDLHSFGLTPIGKAVDAMRAAYAAQWASPGSAHAYRLLKIAAHAMERAGIVGEDLNDEPIALNR